jgi:hypothetical protein
MAVTGEARWVGIGTAFVVSVVDEGRTALLFTAAHNLVGATTLDPYRRRAAHASLPDDFALADQPTLGSTKMYVLTANGTPAPMDIGWWRADADVALLSATVPEDLHDRFDMRLPIDTRAEVRDEQPLIAIGFPQLDGKFAEPPDYEAERFRVTVQTLLDARPGRVIRAVRTDDEGTHTGMGLLVTCAIDAGMSGGPVVEERDNRLIVRAVASRSLSTKENTARGSGDHAFVGLLLPSLAIKTNELSATTESHGVIEGPTVLDLIRAGVIEDVGRAQEWARLIP